MENALTNDQIAAWLRKVANELFDAAQNLSNQFRVQGREAELEQDSLEQVVNILEPCRTPPMPEKITGEGPRTLQPIRLTPELLGKIGLRREDISMLAGRLPLIEVSPEKALSKGAESIINSYVKKQRRPRSFIAC